MLERVRVLDDADDLRAGEAVHVCAEAAVCFRHHHTPFGAEDADVDEHDDAEVGRASEEEPKLVPTWDESEALPPDAEHQ